MLMKIYRRIRHWLAAFENQQFVLVLIASLPPILLLLVIMQMRNYSVYMQSVIAFLFLAIAFSCAISIRHRTTFSFRTLANLLETMNQGDYSLRGRYAHGSDALDEVMDRINKLADTLAAQNLQTIESQQLLKKVTDQIDVAMLAVSQEGTVSSINPSTSNLLGLESNEIVGKSLKDLNLEPLINVDSKQLVKLHIGKHSGKFYIHVDRYIEQGHNYKLILINDIQRILQDEERDAWQNLLRVLSHEINNSLSPIASISDTLQRLAQQDVAPATLHQELISGTTIIKDRASSLAVFINGYSQLTKLAEPSKQPVELVDLVRNVRPLFPKRTIEFSEEENITMFVDPVQFQQLFINLLKNSDEATSDPQSTIAIKWEIEGRFLSIHIIDQGTGIANPDNLFVPFYSTKGQGSGIGLVLSRQIVINHYGRLVIQNRDNQPGAEAIITIPHWQ